MDGNKLMNAGFYKFNDRLLYAANWVRSPSCQLHINDRNTYSYPVDGWYWFDTLEEACLHFGINIENVQDYLP